MENNTYVIRAQGGKLSHILRENGFIALNWFKKENIDNFDIEKAKSRTYVKERLSEIYNEYSSVGLGLATGMNFRFINEVSIGDKIISPTYNNKIMIGKVISDCYVEIDDKFTGVIRRKVEWSEDVDKDWLSDEIKRKLHCNLTFFSVDEEIIIEDTEDIGENIIDVYESENTYCGYTYFMKSQTIPDVYKIGKADDVNSRENNLLKDNRYGVFNLKILGWVKVVDPYRFEKLFHTYYQNYRLFRKNGIEVDTELFKTDKDFYDMWKKFIKINYLDNEEMKDEIIEYNFS